MVSYLRRWPVCRKTCFGFRPESPEAPRGTDVVTVWHYRHSRQCGLCPTWAPCPEGNVNAREGKGTSRGLHLEKTKPFKDMRLTTRALCIGTKTMAPIEAERINSNGAGTLWRKLGDSDSIPRKSIDTVLATKPTERFPARQGGGRLLLAICIVAGSFRSKCRLSAGLQPTLYSLKPEQSLATHVLQGPRRPHYCSRDGGPDTSWLLFRAAW